MRQVRMTALGLLAGLCMAPALGQTGAAPPTDPPAAAPAAPAAEPAAIAQLRALLGPAVTLEFTRAVPDGAGLRLEGVRLKTEVGARLEAPALTVAEVAADGIGMASAREVVFVTPDDDRVTIGGLELRGLRLDRVRREVTLNGQRMALTEAEFKLLEALSREPGLTVSREALNAAMQPGGYRPQDRTVDTQIYRLRGKLQAADPGCDWIATVRGQGYALLAGHPAGSI